MLHASLAPLLRGCRAVTPYWPTNIGARRGNWNKYGIEKPYKEFRQGATLTELLVVIALCGALLSLLMPTLQSSRETARRAACASNLRQILLALTAYESSIGVLPPGRIGCDCSMEDLCGTGGATSRVGTSGFTQLLPYLEQAPLYDAMQLSTRPGALFPDTSCFPASDTAGWDSNLGEVLAARPRLFACPSDTAEPLKDDIATGSYAFSHGSRGPTYGVDTRLVKLYNTGMFNYRVALPLASATDGLSSTIFVGEVRDGHLNDNPNRWLMGRRHADSMRTTENPLNMPPGEGMVCDLYGAMENGAFSSRHSDGAQFGFGDASVHFISDNIALHVYQSLSSRNDYITYEFP